MKSQIDKRKQATAEPEPRATTEDDFIERFRAGLMSLARNEQDSNSGIVFDFVDEFCGGTSLPKEMKAELLLIFICALREAEKDENDQLGAVLEAAANAAFRRTDRGEEALKEYMTELTQEARL